MLANLYKKNYPVLSPVPPNTNYALVFDVETTGLVPKNDPVTKRLPPIEAYPHVIQLSWVLYNMKTNMFDDVKNFIIKVPDTVAVTDEITQLTGITREMCDAGVELPDVLVQFYELYLNADIVVAHNLQFDATMISAEMMRHRTYLERRFGKALPLNIFSDEYTAAQKIDLYCTMIASKDVCNIWVDPKPKAPATPPPPAAVVILPPSSSPPQAAEVDETSVYGSTEELVIIPARAVSPPPPRIVSLPKPNVPEPKKYKKFPKLSELHEHLFGYVPEDLHNALVDTMVCLRCFLKIRCGYHMSSRKFGLILQRYLK